MGLNGSDVAREAADVVLMDDNFASIVTAIEQGRLVFDNLIKTIAYTLTHLWPEIFPVLLWLGVGMPKGLTSIQILSIDLGTELAPAISLAYEKQEQDLMRRKPRNVKNSKLASPQLLVYAYLIAGVLVGLAGYVSYILVFNSYGISQSDLVGSADKYFLENAPIFCSSSGKCYEYKEQLKILAEADAAWHIIIVMSQFFHIWLCRTRNTSVFKHGFSNIVTIYGVILELALILVFVYVPKVQGVWGSTDVSWEPWIISLITGIILLIYNEGRKWKNQTDPTSKINHYLMW